MLARILLFSFLSLNLSSAFACGVYELSGVVRFNSSEYRIIVNEGTTSEIIFVAPPTEAVKLFPFQNAPVKAAVLVLEPLHGTRARISEIRSVELRVPDPLHPALDTRYSLKSKMDCKK